MIQGCSARPWSLKLHWNLCPGFVPYPFDSCQVSPHRDEGTGVRTYSTQHHERPMRGVQPYVLWMFLWMLRWTACRDRPKILETMERETGIEPATSSLGSWRSTAELLPLGYRRDYHRREPPRNN